MVNQESNLLFQKTQEDDKNAFETLFKKLFPRLCDFSYRIVKDEDIAQDIVQDVFIKLWEKRKELKNINIEAFLYKVVRNQCITHIKNVRIVENVRTNLTSINDAEELYRIDFVRDEPYLLVEKELQLAIERVINGLPDQCKNVFMLSRIEGLKNKEIAEKLDINNKNVERHITRALRTFKAQFGNLVPLSVIILILRNLK
jgi:RNA polymerase sigma-70 factor (ECF subfamily)